MLASGVVYRSDSLDRLDDQGHVQLEGIGLTRVVDLRSDEEIAAHGRYEGPAEWLHRPMGVKPSDMKSLVDAGHDPMMTNYVNMTTSAVGVVLDALADIATASGPVVFHCTSGNDRTGVMAALIQLTVGVDADVVFAEYHESSRNVDAHLELMDAKYPEMAARIPVEQRRRMAGTESAWLEAALAPVIATGGVDEWLQHTGADVTLADRLRSRLLSPVVQ